MLHSIVLAGLLANVVIHGSASTPPHSGGSHGGAFDRTGLVAAVPTASDTLASREREIISQALRAEDSEELDIYLGQPPSSQLPRRYSKENRRQRLIADPAIRRYYGRIEDPWFRGSLTGWGDKDPLFKNLRELVQCKVMLARNLYFRKIEPSRQAVKEEYLRILRQREKLKDVKLFADREVVYAASGDVLGRDSRQFMFGSRHLRNWIGEMAAQFRFLRPDRESGASSASLGRLLKDSAQSQTPLTVLFEGHGRRSALVFGGPFKVKRLASALVAMSSKSGGSSPPVPAIVILDACQSHTYSRQLLELLEETQPGTAKPILITPEEYGQDFIKEIHYDVFLRRDLGIGSRELVNLGAVVRNARINASVYVPDDDNVPMQIS